MWAVPPERIPFLDLGGDGAPVVFLHANGFPPACYRPLLDRIAAHHRTRAMLMRPLWPGQRPQDLGDWGVLSGDLLSFLDQQKLSSSIGVGHSMGAIAILRAALQEPQRFRALVLFEPVLISKALTWIWRLVRLTGLGKQIHPLIPGALRRQRTFDNLDSAFERYRGRPVFRYFSDAALRAYLAGITAPFDGRYVLTYSPEWEARIYETGQWNDDDLWNLLPRLAVPTLIVRAAESTTLRESVARQVERQSRQVRIAVVKRATHLLPLERPTECFDLMESFLKAAAADQ